MSDPAQVRGRVGGWIWMSLCGVLFKPRRCAAPLLPIPLYQAFLKRQETEQWPSRCSALVLAPAPPPPPPGPTPSSWLCFLRGELGVCSNGIWMQAVFVQKDSGQGSDGAWMQDARRRPCILNSDCCIPPLLPLQTPKPHTSTSPPPPPNAQAPHLLLTSPDIP